MTDDTFIWSPVIKASLLVPHYCQQQYRFKTHQMVRRLEDLKIKIKNPRAELQGRKVEVRMNLEIIALMEDNQGDTQVLKRLEIIKERVPLQDFDRTPAREGDSDFIIQIKDLNWDGDIQHNELVVCLSLQYLLYETREQIVSLNWNEKTDRSQEADEDELPGMEPRMDQIRNENHDLAHRLYLYERNIISLQRGIRKAENRNAELNREISGFRELVDQLRSAITRKDLIISRYENPCPQEPAKVLPFLHRKDGEEHLGQRIKRMFLSSL